MGDNGTYDPVVSAPFRHGYAKGTIYEGGVNVPLIITGPDIESGGVSEALVNSTDLFATIMEMAGVDPDEVVPDEVTHDSVSFSRHCRILMPRHDVTGYTRTNSSVVSTVSRRRTTLCGLRAISFCDS